VLLLVDGGTCECRSLTTGTVRCTGTDVVAGRVVADGTACVFGSAGSGARRCTFGTPRSGAENEGSAIEGRGATFVVVAASADDC